MPSVKWTWVVTSVALAACNAMDEAPSDETTARVIVPTDVRPAVQALKTPPPIIGGTLAVTEDGGFAVAADPDRDRVSVVNLSSGLVTTLQLAEGDEPGRVAIDQNGFAHVALRRAGAILDIDLSSEPASIVGQRSVCAAPRGVAVDSANNTLRVACTSGELVTLPLQGEGRESATLPEDLRDVLMMPDGRMLISRFKTAQLLSVDGTGAMLGTTALQSVTRQRQLPVESSDDDSDVPLIGPQIEQRTMGPQVAWRTASSPDGSVWMLHQVEDEGEIDIEDREPSATGGSSYGGGGAFGLGCEGIVQTAITQTHEGTVNRTLSVNGAVVAVDMAVSPTGQALAIAQAGTADSGAPRPSVEFVGGGSSEGVARADGPDGAGLLIVRTDAGGDQNGCQFADPINVGAPATAVAYTQTGRLLVQTREPARLVVLDNAAVDVFSAQIAQIDLGGESVADTGHDLFHRDGGAGIACAGCHAEGGDDGHVWTFSTIGARRTQAVNVGLAGTAPFHWDGDMKNLNILMEEVFIGRMGGVHQSSERLDVLQSWLFSQRPDPAMVSAEDESALRGKDLFESAEVGCTGCHNGEALTNNQSADVGTSDGVKLQVPSLRGIGYRAPFIHNGCADTLADRFDPKCGGGDKHGKTSQLDDVQVQDLVAYLKTL